MTDPRRFFLTSPWVWIGIALVCVGLLVRVAAGRSTHGTPDVSQEQRAWWGDATPNPTSYIVSGCTHSTSGTTSASIASCKGYALNTGSPRQAEYFEETSSKTVTYSGGNGTYWLIAHASIGDAVAGWTRNPVGSHYLWQLSANQPVTPNRATLLLKVTVAAAAISAIEDQRTLTPVAAAMSRVFVATYATGGDGTVNRPWTGWDTAITWSKPNQLVEFQAGYFSLTAPILITAQRIHIRGAGKVATTITYAPTGDNSNGVFHFSTGINAVLYQNSIQGFSLLTNDTTFKKVGIALVDVSEFYLGNIQIGQSGTWKGNTSVGVLIKGREISVLEQNEINGDIPIQISDNPNSTIDIDHFTLRNNYTIQSSGTGVNPNILIDTGVNASNLTVDGLAAINGSGALRWVDTTTTQSSLAISLKNIRFEQGAVSTSYILEIQHNQNVLGVVIENVYGGTGTAHKGFLFRRVQQLTLKNVTYVGTAEALNVDSTIFGLILENCFWQTGATKSITGQTVLWSVFNNTLAQTLPTSAIYVPTTGGDTGMVVAGKTVWQSSGTLADATQSAALFPFGQAFTIATVLVVCRGVTKNEGGQVMVYTGHTATLISGTANFGVGNVPGKFTVFASGTTVTLYNQLGESVDYLVTVFRAP